MLSPRSPRIVCTTNCTSASTTPRSSFTHSTTRREASENRGIYYYCFHYYFSAVFHDLNFKFFLFLFSVRLWPFTFTYYLFLFLFAASAALAHRVTYFTISHLYNYPPDQLTTTRFYETGRVSFFIYFLLLFLLFLLFFVYLIFARVHVNKVGPSNST